jgi:hypothetical protein
VFRLELKTWHQGCLNFCKPSVKLLMTLRYAVFSVTFLYRVFPRLALACSRINLVFRHYFWLNWLTGFHLSVILRQMAQALLPFCRFLCSLRLFWNSSAFTASKNCINLVRIPSFAELCPFQRDTLMDGINALIKPYSIKTLILNASGITRNVTNLRLGSSSLQSDAACQTRNCEWGCSYRQTLLVSLSRGRGWRFPGLEVCNGWQLQPIPG